MRTKFVLATLLLFLFSAVVSAQPPPPPAPDLGDAEIILEGLTSPQGLLVDSEGNLWITEGGLAGEEEIEFFDPTTYETTPGLFGETARIMRVSVEGEAEAVAMLPSVAVGMDFLGGGRLTEIDENIYVTYGVWIISNGEEPTIPYFGEVIAIDAAGEVSTVASVWENERDNNPDGTGNLETHPYGITVGPDGLLWVADAAGNSLVTVDPASGVVETVIGFPGEPGILPNPFREPGECDPVPTAVAFNDAFEEGVAYVSYLSCTPFIPGSAKVVQVDAEGELSDFAPGLTMLTDLQTGPDGNLYATQFGVFEQQGPVFNSGAVVRILEDGSAEVVVDGLPFVTAIAFDADGGAYVAINGAGIPNAGMVIYYEGLTEMEGTPVEAPATE